MNRTMTITVAYVQRYLLQWLSARGFALTLMLDQSLTPLLGLLVWRAALPGQQTLTAYYIALLVTRLFIASYENYLVAERIYSGDYLDDLLRPHAPILATLGESISVRLWLLLLGIPMIIGVTLIAPYPWQLDPILLALPALFLAVVLHFLYIYALSLTGFWSERAHGVTQLGETLVFLLGGTAIPIALLPEPTRAIFMALPFYSMVGLPADVAVGNVSGMALMLGYLGQLVWGAILVWLANLMTRQGIRRYTALGG